MNGSSNDNGKVSDSAYTNMCVSQSQRSSGSSLSRNTNPSESSGYGCGNPSAGDSSNYALPKPISKHKEHKKKKSKAATVLGLGKIETKFGSQINYRQQKQAGAYNSNESSSDLTSNCKKTAKAEEEIRRNVCPLLVGIYNEEIAGVVLVDDTGLGDHNGDSNSTEPEGGIGAITSPLEDPTSNINAEFCTVISMKKGRIVNVTPSVKTALGYSRESWIDRSFIEFVHPKDKQTFADCLAKNIVLSYGGHDKGLSGHETSMYCSLRKNSDGLSTMESASDDSNSPRAIANLYVPFRLTTGIKFFRERIDDKKPRMMFLIVNAEPIVPVYKAPEELILSAIFSTRHDRSCILTNVDVNVVQYFGYTPQDMIGRSLFDFYHPEDLPFIKDVYETVVKMKGTPFRSKPYRFAAQNGGYVLLETEWASFYNPWTEKLEFVVGHHRVLRGPTNPNVFQVPGDSQRSLLVNNSEEILKKSKIIQGEIRALLDEKIQRTEDNEEYEITSRSKDLDMFVENLLREVEPPTPLSKEHFRTNDKNFLGSRNPMLQEHDSALLGAISPHHEYGNSKSSTESLPSYKQLNYNEKLTRFFDSKLLVTAPYGSDEDNVNFSTPSNEDAGKTGSNLTGTKEMTLSAENLSSGSNNRTSNDGRADSENPRSANTMPAEDLKIPTLTESVLNKHNQEMEKLLAQQHKERRCYIRDSYRRNKDARLKDQKDKSKKQNEEETKSRAVKRSSTNGREGESCKIFKYDENARICATASVPAEVTSTPMNVDDDGPLPDEATSMKNTNIWPPVTVSPQPSHPHLFTAATNNETKQQDLPRCPVGFFPMVPICYVPLSQIGNNFMPPVVPTITCQRQQNTFAPVAGVIYPPNVCAPAPMKMMYHQFVTPEPVPIHREMTHLNNSVNAAQPENSADGIKQPASQATSIKAEPGSLKAMSESSKKLLSLGEHFLSCVSVDGGCSSLLPNTKCETDTESQLDSSLEDSSDSSFYGSFLTNSNASSCNRKSKMTERPRQISLWKPTTADASTNYHKEPLDMLRKGPPWQEGVNITEELIYQYQLMPKPLNEVLEADMKALKNFNQPQMVNDQLAQLYSDMKVDAAGFSTRLLL